MKILQLLLSILIISDLYSTSRADDNIKPAMEKKPFCNAFTGCGKKRDNSFSLYLKSLDENQLLILIYRALSRLIDISAENNSNSNNNNNNSNNIRQTTPVASSSDSNRIPMMQRPNAWNRLLRPQAMPY